MSPSVEPIQAAAAGLARPPFPVRAARLSSSFTPQKADGKAGCRCSRSFDERMGQYAKLRA